MSSQGSEEERLKELGLLLHAIIFGYQKAVDSVLGAGSVVLVPHAVDGILSLYEKGGVKLVITENLGETMANFKQKFEELGFCKEVVFIEEEKGRFLLECKECTFTEPTHSLISPKIAICPFALLAAAVLQKATGRQVAVGFSHFIKNGAKNYITLK